MRSSSKQRTERDLLIPDECAAPEIWHKNFLSYVARTLFVISSQALVRQAHVPERRPRRIQVDSNWTPAFQTVSQLSKLHMLRSCHCGPDPWFDRLATLRTVDGESIFFQRVARLDAGSVIPDLIRDRHDGQRLTDLLNSNTVCFAAVTNIF